MKTPNLETERLLLRPFCNEDMDDVFTVWESDPEVSKYMYWDSHNDINKTKDWIDFEILSFRTFIHRPLVSLIM